jgi:hypothetical protein
VKRLLVLLAASVSVFALPGAVAAQQQTCTANLSGAQEVPPVNTDASGSATVTISSDGSSLSYRVSYQGLSGAASAAHIHFGARGQNGPVILPLEHGASPFSGTLTATNLERVPDGPQSFAAAVREIRQGDMYVNIHTAANPGGEIRGQLSCRQMPATSTAADPSDSDGQAPLPAALLIAGMLGLALAGRRVRSISR